MYTEQVKILLHHLINSCILGEDEETKKARQQKALEAAFKGLQPTPSKVKKEKKGDDDSSSDSDNGNVHLFGYIIWPVL